MTALALTLGLTRVLAEAICDPELRLAPMMFLAVFSFGVTAAWLFLDSLFELLA